MRLRALRLGKGDRRSGDGCRVGRLRVVVLGSVAQLFAELADATAKPFADVADPAGLPLLSLIIGTYFLLLTPVQNSSVRITEREADAFGINTSREPDGFAAVSLKLGEYRKLNPGKWEEIIFFDHPSGRARIRMAMQWKAAELAPRGGE